MSATPQGRRQVRRVERGRLAYYLEAADAAFWDHHWSEMLHRGSYAESEAGQLGWFEEPFSRHLPKQGTILEAGCGIGQHVLALRVRGYDAVGVEWAERTVRAARAIFPSLPVVAGDVTALPVPDGTFAGYVSLGVMEHRQQGPEPFIREAWRVLAPGGVALISVPHFHMLRRVKGWLGAYGGDAAGLGFYQYAYTGRQFARFLREAGFTVTGTFGYDGVKGLKDEIPALRRALADPERGPRIRAFLAGSRRAEQRFGHMLMFICRKPESVRVVVPEAEPVVAPAPAPPSMHLGVFFTRGMSLAGWDQAGMLDREMALYRRLTERGIKVTFITYGGAADRGIAARYPGIDVLCNDGGLPVTAYEEQLEHVHAAALAGIDVFKTNQMNGAEIALRVARHCGRPLIARCGYLWSAFTAQEHGPGSPGARHARAVEDLVFPHADRVVVTTQAMATEIAGRYPHVAPRITVTPNYVDTVQFAPDGGREKRWDLLVVGRLTPQKNLAMFLDAIAPLPVRAAIVGQGPLEQELRRHPASLAGTVEWLGRVPSERLPDLHRSSTVFVLPSLYEGHPKALLEAMASGMPVVGTAVPGIADVIVPEQTGLLCAASAEALRGAIVRVLSDTGLAARLGAAAREAILATCSLDRVVERERTLLLAVHNGEPAAAPPAPAPAPAPREATLESVLGRFDDRTCIEAVGQYLTQRARAGRPDDGLRLLFGVEDALYPVEGELAVRYGGGVHTKHRHMKYHDFFVDRVRRGESVLDVGCGIGAVAHDVAVRSNARVTGIDLNERNIAVARERYAHPSVTYVTGDALQLKDTGDFDVIILSNVLEHIAERPAFLGSLVRSARPHRLLIRVPLFERDWRIPLRRELQVEYRLDPTHETEYTLESFAAEMDAAGLRITHQEVRWGEVWAECEPVAEGAAPRVSVIMSTFNNATYLPLAMESIAQQTFRDFEWIVVDDGSTDDTAAVLARYADPRLRVVVHAERRGLTRSLNEALALSRGTYVARMDGDDIALPERFARQVAFLDAHPAVGLVGTAFMYIDGQNAVHGTEPVFETDEAIRSRLLRHNCFGHGTIMARRSLLVAAGGYDETFTYAQDYDLWLRLAEKARVANLPDRLYCWRQNAGSVSNAHRAEQDAAAARARARAMQRGILPVPEPAGGGVQ